MYSKLVPVFPVALNPTGLSFADPFGWTDKCVSGIGTVSATLGVDWETWEATNAYFAVSLTANTEYTFYGVATYSRAKVDIYNSAGTKVKYNTGEMNEDTWEWIMPDCKFTPGTTGTYIVMFSNGSEMGDGQETYALSISPRPSTLTKTGFSPWVTSSGFTNRGIAVRHRMASKAGMGNFAMGTVFAFSADKGLVDLSADPVSLTAYGSPSIVGGVLVFDADEKYVVTASNTKLNLGVADFTVEIVGYGIRTAPYPTMIGSYGGPSNSVIFGYKHAGISDTAITAYWGALAVASVSTITDNTTYTMRFVRSNNIMYLYLNKVLNAQNTISNASTEVNLNNAGSGMCIARNSWDGGDGQFYGGIKSIRIWNKAVLP